MSFDKYKCNSFNNNKISHSELPDDENSIVEDPCDRKNALTISQRIKHLKRKSRTQNKSYNNS